MARPYFLRPLTGALLGFVLSLFILSNWTVTDAQTTTLYSFQSLDVLGATSTWPIGINNSGQVAGYYYDNANRTHGFVYSRGTFTTLDPPGATFTTATSINNSGQVAGHYSDGNKGHGFVYDDGALTTFDVPGGDPNYPRNTSALSINDSGQVVGYYSGYPKNHIGRPPLVLPHGFMYSHGAFIMLEVPGSSSTSPTSINASGQVAGSYYAGGSDGYARNHGFVYSNGTFTTLDVAGAIDTMVSDINASGQVIGTYVLDPSAPGVYYGFVYSKGTFTTLDAVGATSTSLLPFTSPKDINASGQIVGWYGLVGEVNDGHGFVYSNGAFTTLDVPGAQSTYPSSINDHGQVTGIYSDGSNAHGFIATPMGTPTDIPTLSQWALLLGGLLLGGIAWRTLVGRTHSLQG